MCHYIGSLIALTSITYQPAIHSRVSSRAILAIPIRQLKPMTSSGSPNGTSSQLRLCILTSCKRSPLVILNTSGSWRTPEDHGFTNQCKDRWTSTKIDVSVYLGLFLHVSPAFSGRMHLCINDETLSFEISSTTSQAGIV